jgi:hypothetical protein
MMLDKKPADGQLNDAVRARFEERGFLEPEFDVSRDSTLMNGKVSVEGTLKRWVPRDTEVLSKW